MSNFYLLILAHNRIQLKKKQTVLILLLLLGIELKLISVLICSLLITSIIYILFFEHFLSFALKFGRHVEVDHINLLNSVNLTVYFQHFLIIL